MGARDLLDQAERLQISVFAEGDRLGIAVAVAAGEPAHAFMAQFNASRQESIGRTIDASPVASAVLDWYAQSSNWRREVRIAGPHRNWINSPAAIDRGARAKFVLMATE